ncbi:hypothetical protein F4781DRAFT_444079 [Annulohypoxylon bovei var. microspora]|nr:hypothetical protein F4781DRAFT_444079 [Annulohypoxylon bovei var. microspora]
MDNNIKRALNGLSATTHRSRIPLSNRSNISSSLARQRSPETRWDRKDSSESQPSSHDSIYDAAWASDPSEAARSPYQTPDPALVPVSAPTNTHRPMTPPSRPNPIDPSSESPLSKLEQSASASTFETQFLYGHGTELAPIAEQRSIATLRTAATGSSPATSNISPLLKHQPSSLSSSSINTPNENSSNHNTPPRRPLRRQQSFSLDDLSASPALSNQRRSSGSRRVSGENSEPGGSSGVDGLNLSGIRIPRLRTISKRHSPPTVETVNIHAYPQKPLYPPHQAPPTPVGYAEWLSSHGARASHHYPAHPSTVFEQPFRGVRSGHGNLETHPFMRRPSQARPTPGPPCNTPLAPRKGLRVRGGVLPGGDACDPVLRVELWVCKACGRPADQRWSLLSTLVGQGAGMRRGDEWCTRCCWRKMVHMWCCCEPLGESAEMR